MRQSLARSRLLENQPVRIACMYYPNAMMPAHAAKAGYDAIWLDAEHNTWDRRELQRMVALHHLANIDCIVRTGSRNASELYHLLEYGAGLDNNFYMEGSVNYPADANRETLLIVQIETPEALENIDGIASTKGVDGLFIGPSDLDLRLNCPLDWEHPKMVASEDAVAAAAARHKIAWGRPGGNLAQIKRIAGKGGKLIAHGSDFGAILSMLPTYAKTFQKGIAGQNGQVAGITAPKQHEA